MKKLFNKNRYRVVEFTDKDEGHSRRFRPERRHLYFFWTAFVREGFEILKETFDTLEEANEFLYQYHKNPPKKKIKKKEDEEVTHEFNEVFYKLKK